jgi:hypothetical protein
LLTSDGTDPAYETLTSLMDSAFGNTRGQVLYRGASGWEILAVGTNGQFLTSGGAGADVSWTTLSATNALLDGSNHSDTASDAATRGSVIVGNSSNEWDEVVASSRAVLASDGTDTTMDSSPTVTSLQLHNGSEAGHLSMMNNKIMWTRGSESGADLMGIFGKKELFSIQGTGGDSIRGTGWFEDLVSSSNCEAVMDADGGYIDLTTGTAATNNSDVHTTENSAGSDMNQKCDPFSVIKIRTGSDITNLRIFAGYASSNFEATVLGTDTPGASHIGFQFSPDSRSDLHWQFVSLDEDDGAPANNTIDTGVEVEADTTYYLTMNMTGGGNSCEAQIYSSDMTPLGSIATITSQIPDQDGDAGFQNPGVGVETTEAAAKRVKFYWWRTWIREED